MERRNIEPKLSLPSRLLPLASIQVMGLEERRFSLLLNE